jgi:hypothetical protein
MYENIFLPDFEPLNLGAAVAIRIKVKVVFTQNNFGDRLAGRLAVGGSQDVAAIDQGPAASIDGTVGTNWNKIIQFTV